MVLASGGGDDGAKKESKKEREVLLETVASAGAAPFTPPIAPETPPVTVPTTVAGGQSGGRAPAGPFGGTGDNTLCDRELLIQFLTDPANATQAREWTRIVGISVADIPTYVRDLIPTVLTSDTRVTNHTFEGGRARGYQAVLQAGTAVLVDTKGKLVARCRCGNPLLPPVEVVEPVYTGPRWPGFNPTTVIVIQVSQTNIYPPGGTGTLPGATTTTTTRRGGGDADDAIAIVRGEIERCAASLGSTLDPLTYRTESGATSDIIRVIVSAPDGEYGTWDVDLDTGSTTAVDPVAVQVGSFCPELA